MTCHHAIPLAYARGKRNASKHPPPPTHTHTTTTPTQASTHDTHLGHQTLERALDAPRVAAVAQRKLKRPEQQRAADGEQRPADLRVAARLRR